MNKHTVLDRNIPKEIKISKLTNGHTTVRGRLKSIDTMRSPITKTTCIGYLIIETMKHGKKPVSETKCKDFFIEDETGKIKVKGKGLLIAADTNKNIIKTTRYTTEVEYLLLENNNMQYVLVGDAETTKKGELVIKKAMDHRFTIEEADFHDIMNNKTIRFIAFGLVSIIIFIILFSMIRT